MPTSVSKKTSVEWPLGLKALVDNLNTAGPDFDELRADVQKLIQPPPIPASARSKPWASPRAYWLWQVVKKKIPTIQPRVDRVVLKLSRLPADDRDVLRLGEEMFVVRDVPHLAGKRQTVYWLLDEALKNGRFAEIRRCGWCSKYFTTTRSDQIACNPKCNVKRQNAKRRSTEDRLDPYTQARWEYREASFKQAKKLKEKGHSFQDIERETGLSERVFKKEQAGLGLIALLESSRERGLLIDR